jgi:hypothetical protein
VISTKKHCLNWCQWVPFDEKSSILVGFPYQHVWKKRLSSVLIFFRFGWFWFSWVILGYFDVNMWFRKTFTVLLRCF